MFVRRRVVATYPPPPKSRAYPFRHLNYRRVKNPTSEIRPSESRDQARRLEIPWLLFSALKNSLVAGKGICAAVGLLSTGSIELVVSL